MTLVVHALVDHALRAWELNRVEVRVAPDNTRSRAIPERLGFREKAVLDALGLAQRALLDSVVYGMIASDWEARG
jgi:ribosomal-protein-serine acetyltransferase